MALLDGNRETSRNEARVSVFVGVSVPGGIVGQACGVFRCLAQLLGNHRRIDRIRPTAVGLQKD